MNFAQFGLFLLFVISSFISGVFIYNLLDPRGETKLNRTLYLGECLLLGNILQYGVMLLLSIAHLYTAMFLWGSIVLSFLFLIVPSTRTSLKAFFSLKISFSIPLIVFICFLIVFIFRNCFFLVDVDSHSSYLFTQKVWLTFKHSLVSDPGIDVRTYVPQFDAVFYGFGLSVFKQETLFPQLINLYWRIIVCLLAFGYTSYRLGRYYGLAAALLIMFDYHYFYSGANKFVIINAALIAFMFAAAYNFWEGRRNLNFKRFLLGIIFLGLLPANKYQAIPVFIYMLALGVFIQASPRHQIKWIFSDKKRIALLCSVYFIAALWYIKNWITTGLPTFPIFAGYFSTLDWSSEQSYVFMKVTGGLTLRQFLKYIGYLFHWHGHESARYAFSCLILLPFMLLKASIKGRISIDKTIELVYWLGLSILCVFGLVQASHHDPRYYTYPLGVLTFAFVFAFNYIFTECFRIKERLRILPAVFVLILALKGMLIIFSQGGEYLRPTFSDNIKVISNRMHMNDAIARYYPETFIAYRDIARNRNKFLRSAWDNQREKGYNHSAFLLPFRSQISQWYTTLIKWESYGKEELIVKDLLSRQIENVMRVENGRLKFLSSQKFAAEAVQFDMRPKTILYDYDFPRELKEIVY